MTYINPHSVRKYENGKSGLMSGAITLPPLTKHLSEKPDAKELVEWMYSLLQKLPAITVKTLIKEKFKKGIITGVHVLKPVETFYPSITITQNTTEEEFFNWITTVYKWNEELAIEATKVFTGL